MELLEINGFYSNVVDAVETRQYTAKDYLKNQHIFLKQLADLLDCDSKAGHWLICRLLTLKWLLRRYQNELGYIGRYVGIGSVHFLAETSDLRFP